MAAAPLPKLLERTVPHTDGSREATPLAPVSGVTPRLTGGSSDYYKIDVVYPTTPTALPYVAECNDIIEALGMNYAEGNAFKAIWRVAAKRLNGGKPGTTALYDSEKVVFFGQRMVEQNRA